MTRSIRILALFMILFVVAPAPCTADDPARVLIVVTNHGRMGDLDEPTGYWLAEVAHPWAHFVDAGFLVGSRRTGPRSSLRIGGRVRSSSTDVW